MYNNFNKLSNPFLTVKILHSQLHYQLQQYIPNLNDLDVALKEELMNSRISIKITSEQHNLSYTIIIDNPLIVDPLVDELDVLVNELLNEINKAIQVYKQIKENKTQVLHISNKDALISLLCKLDVHKMMEEGNTVDK